MKFFKKNTRVLLTALALIVAVSLLTVSCGKNDTPEKSEAPSSGTALENSTPVNKTEAPVEVPPVSDPAGDAGEDVRPEEDFVATMPQQEGETADGHPIIKAVDFSLTDQNGNRHNLKDYAGKVVVLNFWQSWCGPCKMEMPDFQEVYENYGENQNDVVILGVQTPKNALNTIYAQEQLDAEGIAQFLTDGGYTYPTLMDYTGEMFFNHSIQSFPTTYFINPDGYVYGLVPGMIDKDTLTKLIEDTKTFKAD